jgi:hypothetical protein
LCHIRRPALQDNLAEPAEQGFGPVEVGGVAQDG